MRRSLLLTIAALGAVVSLTGAGLFAALTDSATTGSNAVESAPLAASADIQVGAVTLFDHDGVALTCESFSEDLSTGFFDLTGFGVDAVSNPEYLCIRNVGSRTVSVSAFTDSLTDIDIACTGDEALYDTEAGSCGGDGPGELSDLVLAGYYTVDCATNNGPGQLISLKENQTNPYAVDVALAPGAIACLRVDVSYEWRTTIATPEAVQKAQSDKVTWRYRFDATVV